MYEEIFEDLEKVQDLLEKAGRKDVSCDVIFGLLEDLKSPQEVAQIFMESKDLNNSILINSDSEDLSEILTNLKPKHRGTDVEVIKEVKNETKTRITVDLTKNSEKNVPSKVVSKESTSEHSDVHDLDLDDPFFEDSNQNDCSNDSDLNNYYTNSDYEDDEQVEKKQPKAESPPLILSILKDMSENLHLPKLPTEPLFHSARQVENFEILEENNNDPNNNNDLEEIQIGEQNQPKSPVPGCSRDFNERESRRVSPLIFPVQYENNLESKPSCSKECIQLEESDSEVEELESRVSFQVNYETLLEETEAINRFFPDVSGDVIFSMLDKNRKAQNRVTIVLWDLLPTERPEPNIPDEVKKRKRESDSDPPNVKKTESSFALSKIDNNTIKKIQEDVKESEKMDISEIDLLQTSTQDVQTEKCSTKIGNLDTKSNKPKEAISNSNDGKNSHLLLKPAKFLFQSNPVAENLAEIAKKKNIIAPAVLNLSTAPKTSQSAPKRKLPLPTSELFEEGFISEGTDSPNTVPNPLSQVKQAKSIDLATFPTNRKRSKSSGGIDALESISSTSSSKLSPAEYEDVWSSIDDLIAEEEMLESVKNISKGDATSSKVPDKSLPPVQKSANKLEFLNPNKGNQFYQMPTAYVQAQKNNVPVASTSSSDPVIFKKQTPHTAVPAASVANPAAVKSASTGEIPCKDTYYKLRSIFPDIDPAFIKEKCINPPFDANGLNMEQKLNMFVEVLLADGCNHQIHEIRDELDDVGNKDETYENLLGIFPEADPEFLRKFVDDNFKSPDNLKQFIQQNLEKPSYPTRTQYLEKIKITQQIKEYTTDFSIKKFLQIFPDPVAHFENPARKCEYKPMANEFLKDVFRKHKVATINQIYRRKGYHLSLTAKDLRNISPDMKGKRSNYLMPTSDIPLLQEMAYIKYNREIVTHLADIKRKEAEAFENLKKEGMLLECQCCFNNECLPQKCSPCDDGHMFCHDCIRRGTESKISDGQTHITCFENCNREFSLQVLQEVLPPTTLSILLQKRQEAEVKAAGLEGLVSCPFCHFASIPPSESKVFKCLNPECMKETCRLCKELNHVPLKCDEVLKEDQARLKLEEKMTEALVRTCYKCQKAFFKEEGCNKMTCVCGASMCYLCSTPLVNGDYKHFNGQGSSNSNLCPLWSDNRRMNAEAVRKIAEVTENELRKKNPNLKVTAKSILPTLPPKTRGPHDDIPNANALPEYVLRIANNP